MKYTLAEQTYNVHINAHNRLTVLQLHSLDEQTHTL